MPSLADEGTAQFPWVPWGKNAGAQEERWQAESWAVTAGALPAHHPASDQHAAVSSRSEGMAQPERVYCLAMGSPPESPCPALYMNGDALFLSCCRQAWWLHTTRVCYLRLHGWKSHGALGVGRAVPLPFPASRGALIMWCVPPHFKAGTTGHILVIPPSPWFSGARKGCHVVRWAAWMVQESPHLRVLHRDLICRDSLAL